MNSHSKQIGPRLFWVQEGDRTFIEAGISACKQAEIRQFECTKETTMSVVAEAKAWQAERTIEIRREYKRLDNLRRDRERRARELQAIKDAEFERLVERLIASSKIVEAARRDVQGVWARYGPALDTHRMYVPDFQWI